MNSKCEKCKSAKKLDFEISMAFQPIVDLTKFEIYGYEALVRGTEGQGAGFVFEHVNEDNLYLFDQTCRRKAIELASRLELDKFLSINFMPNAVYEPSRCIQTTLNTAKKYNFPLDMIVFEFTEREEMLDSDHVTNILVDYKKRGFLTAVDDFGAGYSGLNMLSQVEVDIVKLDRKLIQDIDKDPRRIRLLRSLKDTIHTVASSIVVEGVETEEELKCLYSIGYRRFQGYYFAKPGFECLPDVDLKAVRQTLGEKRFY